MHTARRFRRWALGAALLALGGVWLSARLAAQDATGSLVGGGEKPELFLLYTGDVIGYVEPCG